MADMIKRRILSESKDAKTLWMNIAEKANEVALPNYRIYQDTIVKNLEKADNLMQSNCTTICLNDF